MSDQTKRPFLYPDQMNAVNLLSTGKILCGGVGSGKSRVSLFYFFKENGGWIDENGYKPMVNPKDLYIITTAKKRDSHEWDTELVPFLMYGQDESDSLYSNKIVIDSWQNLHKYTKVYGAMFVLDEQKISGTGAWVKAFLNIARKNDWILLSATPADRYEDLRPVFIANGFYKNKTEFNSEHLIYDPYCRNYPKVIGYRNEDRLEYYRNLLMVDIDFKRHTIPHHEDVYVKYDIPLYRWVAKERKNPYKTIVWEDNSEHPAPIINAAELCYTWRRVVNSDESRQVALLELLERHPRAIIFYSYDYELEILRNLGYNDDVVVAEWNGHKHQEIPKTEKWVYLVQYFGSEGWNCIATDTVIFYSQQYSYKTLEQARGRIDRRNTPYTDLYYYYLKSRSGIDLAISNALVKKKTFNERKWVKWDDRVDSN